MKSAFPALVLLASLSTSLHAAPTFNLYVGGGRLAFDIDGSFRDLQDGGSKIDLEDDLNLSSNSGTHWYIGLEHDIPLLPNIRLAGSELDESATARLENNIVFDGVVFPAGVITSSEMDLSHRDLTLYYSVLDTPLKLDLGLTIRQFDGGISSQSTFLTTRVTASLDLDATVPLLYAGAQMDLPIPGLYVASDINAATYDGSHFYDIWARIGYVLDIGLGVEAGYRRAQLDVDDIDDLEADLTISGRYLALIFRF